MIKVGIIGAAGYTAGELLRILIHHPKVEIVALQSESQHGKKVSDIHQDLIGEVELEFDSNIETSKLDLVFFCKGHGQTMEWVQGNPEILSKRIIDLSQDYRLKGEDDFVYGLPELNKEKIANAVHVANPGCFATAMQLSLLPVFKSKQVMNDVHISGITGSTGAGQALSQTSHFSWRNGNASVYKAFQHQHLNEVGESLLGLNPNFKHTLNFIPYRGAFTRGIITTAYFNTTLTNDELVECYRDYYSDHCFVHVSDENPNVKMVVNTNKAVIYSTVIEGKAMIISVIDNLLKGASGQAVQNMNIMYGLGEKMGLLLKTSAF